MGDGKRSIRKPFLLNPSGKDYLWGGNRLNDEYDKRMNISPLAETWECSTHPDGASFVASGVMEGQSLTDVLDAHPDYLGTHPSLDGELPVLIKLIDADKDLSVQVHPTDRYALENENGQMGKTEMWYILDADQGAHIVYGLSCDVSAEDIRHSIENGTVNKFLQKVPVEANDVFFIEAGMIHAIGKGVLLAEIQENSNLTYRLYDYDRKDKNGNKRELHLDKALEVANLNGSSEPKQPLRVLKYKPGVASELLGRCKYFEVYRRIINAEHTQTVPFKSDELSFRVILCITGGGTMTFEDETLEISKGNCFFVPADSVEIQLKGKMQLLDVRG